jgi:hypothetical protein
MHTNLLITKRPGRGASHLPPSSAEVNSTPPWAFTACIESPLPLPLTLFSFISYQLLHTVMQQLVIHKFVYIEQLHEKCTILNWLLSDNNFFIVPTTAHSHSILFVFAFTFSAHWWYPGFDGGEEWLQPCLLWHYTPSLVGRFNVLKEPASSMLRITSCSLQVVTLVCEKLANSIFSITATWLSLGISSRPHVIFAFQPYFPKNEPFGLSVFC